MRVDQGSLDIGRNAPYQRFPVLTGTRSEVDGIDLELDRAGGSTGRRGVGADGSWGETDWEALAAIETING